MLDYRDVWLNSFARRVGMTGLRFDDKGICQLSLDQELILTLSKSTYEHHLVIFGQLPVANLSNDVMKKLLIENRNSANQLAPVVSLSESADAIEVNLLMSEEDLNCGKEGVNLVIHCLEYWRSVVFDTDVPVVSSNVTSFNFI
ncbi:CesT family type III secretion system chaperone [uncultured Shewanella sp.]|uniref:CesT family type III secretion system chaperone n=1 Tax=uncultured Shewanella sp. TaxID=173975 RepID=UPI0026257B26|nr:CesT family type III secretion system chaperone [uncultured Shewanella sp.]